MQQRGIAKYLCVCVCERERRESAGCGCMTCMRCGYMWARLCGEGGGGVWGRRPDCPSVLSQVVPPVLAEITVCGSITAHNQPQAT